jgi:hypothetical protein
MPALLPSNFAVLSLDVLGRRILAENRRRMPSAASDDRKIFGYDFGSSLAVTIALAFRTSPENPVACTKSIGSPFLLWTIPGLFRNPPWAHPSRPRKTSC